MKRTGAWLMLLAVLAAAFACGKSTDATPSDGGSGASSLAVSSSGFANNAAIPTKYASTGVDGGQNKSIPLAWSGAPAGTQSFAVAMVDTSALNYVHWVVTDIDAGVTSLAEGASTSAMPQGAIQLKNGNMTSDYFGPEPPPADPAHNYVITVYALNVVSLGLSTSSTYYQFQSAISGKTVAQGSLTGTFDR